ncbi:MAG: aldo/keto reductase [Paenibacillaceae bacterium]|nr:aldo/keto reductase [Paenibacillaceae bacterium]
MEYTYLGKSGLRVSRLCLGTMNFGGVTSEKDAFYIMDAAVDAGINFFDTSNNYGKGKTEEIIGRWFAQGGGRRDKVVLATKVFTGVASPEEDGPNKADGLSAFKIRRNLEASLRRLQTDHIELYQMHHIDRHTSWDELWEAFDIQQYQGKILYVGSSNFGARDLVKAQYEAKLRHKFGLVSEQHIYNLMCRLPELELLPAAIEHGIGVIAYSPMGGGLLGGNARKPAENTRSFYTLSGMSQGKIDRHREQLESFSAFCKEIGESEDVVALAGILLHPGLTAPIVGPRTILQLQSSLRAVEVKLDESAVARLNEIFPGHGPGPLSYARNR